MKNVLILTLTGLFVGVIVALGISNFSFLPMSAGGAIAGLSAFASMFLIQPFLYR